MTDQIAELMELYRQLKGELDAHKEELDPQINAAREGIEALLEERGENWEDEIGYARLRPESERVSFKNTKVDSVVAALITLKDLTVKRSNEFKAMNGEEMSSTVTAALLQQIAVDLEFVLVELGKARKVTSVRGGVTLK